MFLKRAVSGQWIFFDAVSVLSGYLITGFSGAISGTRWSDTGNRTVLSGNIVEVSGGMYRANLYDWDCSGNYMGYLFTASGMVPRSFTFMTIDAASGVIHPASGVNVTVPIASISGNVGNSGLNVTVPIATISGAVANSGLFVSVPIATLSGTVGASGLFANVPIATISGTQVVANSGVTVTLVSGTVYPASGIVAPLPSTNEGTAQSGTAGSLQLAATAISGADHYAGQLLVLRGGAGTEQARTIITYDGETKIAVVAPDFNIVPDNTTVYEVLPAGRVLLASGVMSGQPSTLLSGRSWVASGINTVVPPTTLSGVVAASGLFVNVPIATISGAVGNSGQTVVVIKETISGVVANSGLFVTATATVASGDVYLASGHGLFVSGQIYLASGSLSGQQVTLVSGRSWTASGIFAVATASVDPATISGAHVTVPIATISGVVANSGLNVTLPKETISGVVANSGLFVTATATLASGDVYLASGTVVGLRSGQTVNVYSGQLSGHAVDLLSGRSYPASGVNAAVPPASLSGVVANSGLNVTVLPATLSGVVANSGLNVTVPIASVSGLNAVVPISSISGVVTNSGLFVSVPIATISGVVASSGMHVTVPIATVSGVNAVVPIATISGTEVVATATVQSGGVYLASGHFLFGSGQLYLSSGQAASLNSGQSVLLYSGQLSGQPVSLLSGRSWVASGQRVVAGEVLDKSGYTLSASGLDTITVESGINLRQSQAEILATTAGRLSGAGTTTFQFGNASGVLRLTGTVDSSGNRTDVTWNPPT